MFTMIIVLHMYISNLYIKDIQMLIYFERYQIKNIINKVNLNLCVLFDIFNVVACFTYFLSRFFFNNACKNIFVLKKSN
jgi:hypothetical protein